MHLKLKDFESLIDCNCQNSWDKNLICTELCGLGTPYVDYIATADSNLETSFLPVQIVEHTKKCHLLKVGISMPLFLPNEQNNAVSATGIPFLQKCQK